MPKVKLKTSRGMAKRVKVTGTGKIKCMKAGKSHLLECKNKKRKRFLRKPTVVDASKTGVLRKLVPYI